MGGGRQIWSLRPAGSATAFGRVEEDMARLKPGHIRVLGALATGREWTPPIAMRPRTWSDG